MRIHRLGGSSAIVCAGNDMTMNVNSVLTILKMVHVRLIPFIEGA